MKANDRMIRMGAALLLGVTATAAQAHPGHGGLMSGVVHPWSGWDHMAAMMAVGLWAMTLQGSKRLILPLVFITATLMGALLPVNALALAAAEQGIVLSLLVMGGGLLMALRMPWHAAALLMGLSGLCHGYAHAAEMPVGQSLHAFMAGMFVSTALLHGLGIALAIATTRFRPQFSRYWGLPVVMVGMTGMFLG